MEYGHERAMADGVPLFTWKVGDPCYTTLDILPTEDVRVASLLFPKSRKYDTISMNVYTCNSSIKAGGKLTSTRDITPDNNKQGTQRC